jgi:hypothetical protein
LSRAIAVRGSELVGIFTDEARSGGNLNCPALFDVRGSRLLSNWTASTAARPTPW